MAFITKQMYLIDVVGEERSNSVGLPEEPFEEKGGYGAVAVPLANGVLEDLSRSESDQVQGARRARTKGFDLRVAGELVVDEGASSEALHGHRLHGYHEEGRARGSIKHSHGG